MEDTQRIAMILEVLGCAPATPDEAKQMVMDRPDIFCGYNPNDDFHIDWDAVVDGYKPEGETDE